MSKAHRGRPLKKQGYTRGMCPITGRTGVKLLYEHTNDAGDTILISKSGRAKLANAKKKVSSTDSNSAEN